MILLAKLGVGVLGTAVVAGAALSSEGFIHVKVHDLARLTKIPGVGKKTAERLVLELRDKLPPAGIDRAQVIPTLSSTQEDVLSALVNLGYQRNVAEKALAGSDNGSFDAMFRAALARISK